jgi:hypothetical protein
VTHDIFVPSAFGYRAPLAWLQWAVGIAFGLAAVALPIGGLVALIDGVPFDAGTVAFGTAWVLAAGGFSWFAAFRWGYAVEVHGTTLTWRAPCARARFDLARTPLDIQEAEIALGQIRTLCFGDDESRSMNAVGENWYAFLRNVELVQRGATAPRSP